MRVMMACALWSVHVDRWARGLAEAGAEVSVYAPRTEPLPGVRVYPSFVPPFRWSWPMRWISRYRALLRRTLREVNPDVVHLHMLTPDVPLLDELGGRPLVVSTWGSDISPPAAEPPAERDCKVAILHQAAAVVASSAHLGVETARYAGLAPDRVQVLHWGVDLDQFHPANGPCDRPVIGFIKNLQEVYGPDVLIDCLPELLSALPEARVLMIGGGRLEECLKQRAEHLGVQHAIDWIGYVDYSAVPDYLGRMAVTAMPSRREAFGMAAIESQAMGVPVVASRVGGIPECVLDGTTGLLVPPDDPQALAGALRTVLTDSALRHRLARNGRGHVAAKFNWRTTLQKMIAIYESVVEKRGA